MKNPLFDTQFLYELDHYKNRKTFVRITSLTSDGYPVEQIEGVATAGSITVDGQSAVRRICNLTMTTKNLNINNIYWGLTTRVKIEVGLQNDLLSYKYYPDIIWFPQGVYVLTDFKTSSQVNNYTITLSGKDKMCLLNGDVGGVFNAETDIGTQDTWDKESEKMIREVKPIDYIIREMIHHYAKENFSNIIVKTEPAREILRNNTGHTIYLVEDSDLVIKSVFFDNNSTVSGYFRKGSHTPIYFNNLPEDFIFRTDVDEDNTSGLISAILSGQIPTILLDANDIEYTVRKVEDKEDLGYRLTELIYPDALEDGLVAQPGETITSILDKIVKVYPIYEYFYNLDGQFVFQQKKTYVNTSWNNMISYEDTSYIEPSMVSSYTKYSFEGNQIVTAFQNTPKISDIKNDYTVWGKNIKELPIHMRYAIDQKPDYYVKLKKDYSYTNSDGDYTTKPEIYVTQEFLEKLPELGSGGGNLLDYWHEKKVHPPDYLLNAEYYESIDNDTYGKNYSYVHRTKGQKIEYTPEELNHKWWDILDWAQFYTEVTGEMPPGRMNEYSTASFFGTITFPNGEVFKSNSGQMLFDTDIITGNLHYGPVTIEGRTSARHSPLMHGICSHLYSYFVSLDEDNDLRTWFFCPELPTAIAEKYADKLNGSNVHIVDWREIIYQMALDYMQYGHEDDFTYNLFNRNRLDIQFGLDGFKDIHYINGITGYEQYYHDMLGFWRLLYIPKDEKENYFSQYRIVNVSSNKKYPLSIRWNSNNTFSYDANKTETKEYNLLAPQEYYISTDDEQTLLSTKDNSPLMVEGTTYTLSLIQAREKSIQNIIDTELTPLRQDKDIVSKHINGYNVVYSRENNTVTRWPNEASACWRSSYELAETKDGIKYYYGTVHYYGASELKAQAELLINKANKILGNLNNYENLLLKIEQGEELNNTELDNLQTYRDIFGMLNRDFDVEKTYVQEQIGIQNNIRIAQTTKVQQLTAQLNTLAVQEAGYSASIEYYQQMIQAASLALCPYSIYFDQSQTKNEEDFYENIEYTYNGFPIYTSYEDAIAHQWSSRIVEDPSSLLFWIDFWDADSLGLGQYSVPAIGARPKVINNEGIKVLIYQDVPDLIFVYEEDYKDSLLDNYDGYNVAILKPGDPFREYLETRQIDRSSRSTTAQEEIDNLLYNYGYCNEDSTITTIPVYYLEPNNIISAKDEQQIVNGYYILNKMTIPLSYNGTMQNNCIRVPERIY